jgi:hypothetical protein
MHVKAWLVSRKADSEDLLRRQITMHLAAQVTPASVTPEFVRRADAFLQSDAIRPLLAAPLKTPDPIASSLLVLLSQQSVLAEFRQPLTTLALEMSSSRASATSEAEARLAAEALG